MSSEPSFQEKYEWWLATRASRNPVAAKPALIEALWATAHPADPVAEAVRRTAYHIVGESDADDAACIREHLGPWMVTPEFLEELKRFKERMDDDDMDQGIALFLWDAMPEAWKR